MLYHLFNPPSSLEGCCDSSHSSHGGKTSGSERGVHFPSLHGESGGHTGICPSPRHPRLLSEVTPALPGRPQSWLKSEDISQGPDQDSTSFKNCCNATLSHTLSGSLSNKGFLPETLPAPPVGLKETAGFISLQERTLCLI